MTALVSKGFRKNSVRDKPDFGTDLRDIREEQFVRMACDGLPLGVAYARAGFKLNRRDAPSLLFDLPRIQERAQVILQARRTSGVVSLSEVTDMLKRVFAGAHSEGEYSAAHNAAFSLARLYGHVTDKQTVELIRKPSRDPDAPSEQALASWVDALPGLPAPGPAAPAFGPGPADLGALEGPKALEGSKARLEGSKAPFSGAPAAPLGHEPFRAQPQSPNDFNGLWASGPLEPSPEPQGPSPEGSRFSNDFNWLGPSGRLAPGRPGKRGPSDASN